MGDADTGHGDWTDRNRRNTLRLAYWTLAWLVTLATAVFGPLLFWESLPLLTTIAIVANLAAGVGMIIANKHHLHGLDELQQKIQLEAMALALGVALVAGLAWSTADVTDLIPFDAEISHLVFLIGLTYGLGVLFGRRKYR